MNKIYCKNFFIIGLFVVLFLLFGFVARAEATTIYTNSLTGDDTTGDGSSGSPYATFHKAYTEASSGDTIDLTGTFTWTDADETGDSLTSGYTLNKNLTIQGQGADETIIQADSTPNTAEMRIFTFGSNLTTTIKNITLRYGHQISTSGSALYMTSGSLTILDSYIYQNNNSVNTEYNSEGTYMGDDRYNAGAIVAGGTSFVARRTTFANNTNPYTAVLTVSATNSEVTNSTFVGNNATYETIYQTGGSLVLTNNTIYETDYFVSGSVCIWSGTAYLKNNLIQGRSGLDVNGTDVDGGYNIINSTDGSNISNGVNGNVVGDPGDTLKLSTNLSLNGATNGVPNLALEVGSIAIDAGDSSAHGPGGNTITPPTTDQRGKDRYNVTYDVGSVEYRGASDIGPYLASSSFDSSDLYVDLTFSEGVYSTDGGSGALEASDFGVTFSANGGGATGVTIDSATQNTNDALVGGETVIRLNLSVSGTANGVETFSVYPVTSDSIFDADGNAVTKMDETEDHTLVGYFDYYVDPSGTDDGSHGTGSGTDAWATIQYAIDNVPDPTSAPIRIYISGDTYTTNNNDIDIDRNFTDLVLQGASAATTIVQPHTDPDSSTAGNFDIGSDENVTINDMTIRYGRVDVGSGINISSSGSLYLNRVYVNDNDAENYGGIVANSMIVIDGSTISNNDATGTSTFRRNGLYVAGANSVITNSTIFNNRSSASQSAANLYINSSGDLTMINTTVVGGGTTGGYGNSMIDNGGELYVKNSIFANKDQGSYDIYNGSNGIFSSGGYNIFERYSGFTPDANDITGDQASLNIADSLSLNDTATGVPTLAITADSVAINAGDGADFHGQSIPSVDQRTATRISTVDIGAYEYGGVVDSPYVDTLSPVDNATDTAIDANLVVTFSESVDAEIGNINIYKSDGTLFESFDVTVDISGSGSDTITINPSSDFADYTDYYVTIDTTAFDDTDSNSYTGIGDSTTWNFRTIDSTNPTVSAYFPTSGSSTATTTTKLILTFDEAVDVETGDIVIYNSADDTVFETIDVTSGNVTGSGSATIEINPDNDLVSETEYYIFIDDTAFDDTAGNSYAGISSSSTWVFTIDDFTDPAVGSLTPADDATGVAIDNNLTIEFSENVDTETGNIIIYKASDDSEVEAIDVTSDQVTGGGTDTIVINPSSDLSYETSYYVQVDATAFDDGNSNSYSGISDVISWNFITADTPTCPTVANASTYNAYPTCGVATCEAGYTLTNGICNRNGGGGYTAPPSSGAGQSDAIVPMGETKNLGEIGDKGKNILGYINSEATFDPMVSKRGQKETHRLLIENLDMQTKRVRLFIYSDLTIVELGLGESEEVDLDNDGRMDVRVTYNDLMVNRVDITVTQLDWGEEVVNIMQNGNLVKEKNHPAVYLLEGGRRRPILNAEVFIANGWQWSDIIEVDDLSDYVIGDMVGEVVDEVVHGNKVSKKKGYVFTRDLKAGMRGEDVRELQRFLNKNGYVLTETGLGSVGQETDFFGRLTHEALVRYQKAHNISPAIGYFGPITRGVVVGD